MARSGCLTALPVENPAPRELTPQQAAAVAKLKKLKVGALFCECGTGKTQMAATLIAGVPRADLVMWVCPLRTAENLRKELAECGLQRPVDIYGIESIGGSDRVYMEAVAKLEKAKHAFLVCDESLKIKNGTAKRTRRMLSLARTSEFRLILNGTPVSRNILDLYHQMEFLSPRILNMRWCQFRNRYCKTREIKRPYRRAITVVTGYANVDNLLGIIGPYIYECRLNLSLAKKYDEKFWYFSWDERAAYNDLKDQLFDEYRDDYGEINIVGILSKLQHSYCLSEDKFARLEEIGVDGRTIIFCKFIASAEECRKRYPQALVMTYGTGAFGLNLQKYNRIVFFDKTWDYAFREQSEARIYRNGQQDDCEYWDLTGEPGLEKMLNDCIDRKTTLVEYIKEKGPEIIKKMLECEVKA